MASLTQWTWVWVNFKSWWWTRRPGVLQSMGSQRVRHDWATEPKLNWKRKAVYNGKKIISSLISSFLFLKLVFFLIRSQLPENVHSQWRKWECFNLVKIHSCSSQSWLSLLGRLRYMIQSGHQQGPVVLMCIQHMLEGWVLLRFVTEGKNFPFNLEKEKNCQLLLPLRKSLNRRSTSSWEEKE